MSEKIRVLQLGTQDWNEKYQIPENVRLKYVEKFETIPKKPYDVVFLDRELYPEEIAPLGKATKAYTLFVTENVSLEGEMSFFYDAKMGKTLCEKEIQDFFTKEIRNYFPSSYGEKFNMRDIAIAQGFTGKVKWNGNYSVALDGDYGNELKQIAFWCNNVPVDKGQAIELWLEYKKDPTVEIALSVTQFVAGSVSSVQQRWFFSEKDLQDLVILDNQMEFGVIFVSLLAKGNGKLEIIALNDRYSRRGHGCFIPGGERYVASNREEVFCYFEPGDGKPPFNVFFSGYKTKQGFEGYNLMRGMGSPFLLIAEPRLEGGCFYMGEEEYEAIIKDVIKKYMDKLGFTRKDVIMAGLSMGTYGTLYYGCDIRPHAMILGKPLASIGDVAANETLHRPGGFPTSLDVLKYLCGNTDRDAIQRLNDRFWKKFDATDWSNSKFIVSYMIEDDYDMNAYEDLISHLQSEGVQVYGKGLHGRHNDATGGIVNWFVSQFKKVLHEDFGRRMEE